MAVAEVELSGPAHSAESGEVVPARRVTFGRLALGIVIAVLALDQATKSWAVEDLADGPVSIIGSDVELRLSFNPGGAFGLFGAYTPLLAVVAVVMAVVLARAVRGAEDRFTVIGLSLVLGGALGNLVDRTVREPGFLTGRVVDFVKVGSFPSFNVADSAITVGAVALVIGAFLPRRES
jgi:signal peptidase II